MNITNRIATVLKESYKKKSLAHLYNSFWLFIYSACKLQSLKSALKEQRLDNTFLELKKIIKNYSDQYNHVKIEGEYWNYKVRALHAFQVNFGINSINLVRKNLKKDNLTIVDIGDSSGTHSLYLKKLVKESNLKLVSVNLDTNAIKKIKEKGLEAIHSKAEELSKYNINPDLFMSYQTVEHLNSPITFLKSISQNSNCEYFLLTVPYILNSRLGLEHIRENSENKVHAENIHIFELSPNDWKLLFKHSGWEVVNEKIYYQYPRLHPLRILKNTWAKYDFEGFYGVLLKKNHYWTNKYLDW